MSERGNAGKGRQPGARNKRTLAAQELLDEGETPVEFGLKLMRDESQPAELRLHGARLVAPYLHARPTPVGDKVRIDLPDTSTVEGVGKASAAILSAVAQGDISVSSGRDLVAILDSHRKGLELVDLERRLAALEQGKP